MFELTEKQLDRYARHCILDNVGELGQKKLLMSKVLVIGAGGLGSPVLLYLSSAGIGKLGIVDFDSVDVSNLQRQVIYTEDDIGRLKVTSAKEKINNLNEDVTVVTYQTRLNKDNIEDIFIDYDLIIDGSDNFTTRYLVNRISWKLNKILVSGAISRFEGQLLSINPLENTACYQCIFPTTPDISNISRCDTVGVFGVTTGIVGILQATEAIKILLDIGKPLYNRILLIDSLSNDNKIFKFNKDSGCLICNKE